MKLTPVTLATLPAWQGYDATLSLATFQRSAREILSTAHGFKREAKFGGAKKDWLSTCEQALVATDARKFFETSFVALRVEDDGRPEGLFTGYYEPEAEGSRVRTERFTVPIYKRPADLVALTPEQEAETNGFKYGRVVDGKAMPYFTRPEIEQGALAGKGLEIAWIESWQDAFFIHIQGSGRVRLPDGSALRLAYALKTGHPYTGIGGVLVERGVMTPQTSSMQTIRAWMDANPGEARQLMWHNKSFVFFREIAVEDKDLGAVGAQQVNLTPLRSLAVDRALWMFGMPIWLETTQPPEAGGATFRNLMVAQDTGSAIKGAARGDVYWGWGEKAAFIAGHMKSPGTFTALLPMSVAASLGLL
jgi:membrane-bound lytic murein transglycosylase A